MVHMRHTRRVWLAAAGVGAVVALSACSASNSATGSSPLSGRGGSVPNLAVPSVASDANGAVNPLRQPQSTFGLDIDTASYTYARRQILDGHRPDRTTVRPEEFVNAFRQDYEQPPGPGFSVTLDGSRMPSTQQASTDTRLLRVGLQTRAEDSATRPDAALTFVIDVSGSMAEPGRLDLVKDALHVLIDQLRGSDSVAIVAYSNEATVVRPMTRVESRSALHGAVDELRIEGSTNLEAGVVTGYQVARAGFVPGATNRVILLSDGLANAGDTTAEPILRQIREEAGKQITLLGVGVGSQYGDALMERLADEGDGFVVYVSDRDQARQLFVTQLPATLTVRARDAKAQVSFDPSTVVSYRLLGYEDRALAPSQFRDNAADGGEIGPGHSVTALYVVRLRAGAPPEGLVAQADVRWLDPVNGEAREAVRGIFVGELQGEFVAASARLRVCYAAAFFAEVLRGDRDMASVRLTDLRSVAAAAYDTTEDPQVRDLADMIGRAAELG
jgi:Ca-activated chloride channel family protein